MFNPFSLHFTTFLLPLAEEYYVCINNAQNMHERVKYTYVHANINTQQLYQTRGDRFSFAFTYVEPTAPRNFL